MTDYYQEIGQFERCGRTYKVFVTLDPDSYMIERVHVVFAANEVCSFALKKYDPSNRLHASACVVIVRESRAPTDDVIDVFPDPLDHPDWPDDPRLALTWSDRVQ